MANKVRTTLKPEQYKAIALLVHKDVNGMTNDDVADEVGVHFTTLYNWFKNPTFNQELIKQSEEMQKSFLNDAYVQVRTLINSKTISEGNKLKAIELVLKNQGRLKDVQEQSVTVEDRTVDDMLKELED